jgi:hypothetical protein
MSKVAIKTPFCTICKNSGKSEGQYTSHNVKNRSGSVLCPTILQNICGICNQKGHFKTRCPNKKSVVDSILKPQKAEIKKEKKPVVDRKKDMLVKNCFAVLDDSDSETEYEPVCVEVKCTTINEVKKHRRYINWADVDSSDEESDEE